ncbi:MAG: SDR family oxidoreductase [Thermoplasmata archaeon]|nr:SDR family oxidoreductase [Thermoplasmata archaeon]
MTGRVCVVTGATSGLGEVTARELAGRGAHVALLGRSADRASKVAEQLRRRIPGSRITPFGGDLGVAVELRRVGREVLDTFDRVDVLVNNAGAVFHRRELTPDGNERTWALNVLAPFRLTHLLAGRLRAGAPSRVVNVASAAHFGAHLDPEDFQVRGKYRGFRAYRRSKLALILLTHEFARRWSGSGVVVNALHPGLVATQFGQNNRGGVGWGYRVLTHVAGISTEAGARTQVYLASSPDAERVNGGYFERSLPTGSSPRSYDPEVARRVWDACAAASPWLG